MDIKTKKVELVCHHPVLAMGADWVPGETSEVPKETGSDKNIAAAPILDYGEITRS